MQNCQEKTRYPLVLVDRNKLLHNVKSMVELCKKYNVQIAGVTKVFCANISIARIFLDGGITNLADSRIENLKKLQSLKCEKMMLRIPMLSEITQVVTYSDISLNSQIETIKALSEEALKQKKIHQIILMIDLGDLREGILEEDVYYYVKKLMTLKGVILKGIGVNLNCYGGIIPTKETLERLVEIKAGIKEKFAISLDVISGGNSGSIHLLLDNEKKLSSFPTNINQLRLGEAILRGVETSYQKKIEGLNTDIFTFRAQIVELKDKPSVPTGKMGLDAFGNKPEFQDKGIMKRVIIACGRQDIVPEQLFPRDKDISIIGASSDHTILDVTNSKTEYKVGDIVDFDLGYSSLLSAFTSEYVNKQIVE